MASDLNFKYQIQIAADNEYGSKLADGTWDGMIGEILSTSADLAVGPLTINYEREQKVSFTKPFMNLGVSILFKEPQPKDPGPFSFLQPLGASVWLSILAAFVMVSVALYVVSRVSPVETLITDETVTNSDKNPKKKTYPIVTHGVSIWRYLIKCTKTHEAELKKSRYGIC